MGGRDSLFEEGSGQLVEMHLAAQESPPIRLGADVVLAPAQRRVGLVARYPTSLDPEPLCAGPGPHSPRELSVEHHLAHVRSSQFCLGGQRRDIRCRLRQWLIHRNRSPGDHRRPGSRAPIDHPQLLEAAERASHRSARQAMRFSELGLCRKAIADRQASIGNLAEKALGELLVLRGSHGRFARIKRAGLATRDDCEGSDAKQRGISG
jgi:hypothetical protein